MRILEPGVGEMSEKAQAVKPAQPLSAAGAQHAAEKVTHTTAASRPVVLLPLPLKAFRA
ncbi:hypothetical protein GCM10007977_020830 [Dactylosporangium sucinum]|uniref:Uncharacterized protein n=1 Tax=Dactylosporangium sucinum TaxID=1424081 RepID=A0A917TE21_9ACTN|nr:hypothetical protein GCM10007977_020830 [Dactylosporangium sucinum]